MNAFQYCVVHERMTKNLCIALMLVAPITSADEKAMSIVLESEARDSGFADMNVKVEMILQDRRGHESTRILEISQIEMPEDGDRSLVVMKSPPAIRGTALLSHAHRAKDDEQWIYLPAVSRVKKIASRNKSGPFLSSTFAYEDLLSPEIEKFSYQFLHDDTIDGREHWVIERIPADKNSGYSRQEVWYDQERYTAARIVYFDKQKSLLKTLETYDWRLLHDKYWKPHSMRMTNHQTGKSTKLVWHEYKLLNNAFSANRDFSIPALRRAR